MGIEPIWSAWKAENLPLIYIRFFPLVLGFACKTKQNERPLRAGYFTEGRITGIEPVFSESQSDTLTD